MEANVQYQVMDWKDSPDMKLLHKAIKEIEALGHGSQVVEEHSPICDSKVVLVMPADVNYRGITEDGLSDEKEIKEFTKAKQDALDLL